MVELAKTSSLAASLLTLVVATTPLSASADVEIGGRAPGFTLSNAERGEQTTLSSYRGMTVVVEWVDLQCPAVQKLYESGVVQTLQDKYEVVSDARAGDSGVAWLTISIAPPGEESRVSADVLNEFVEHAAPSHVLLAPYFAVGTRWSVETLSPRFLS